MSSWTRPQYPSTNVRVGGRPYCLGYSTQQKVKEPDLGVDSAGDLWAHLCGTAAPNSFGLCRVVGREGLSQAGPQNSPDRKKHLIIAGIGVGRSPGEARM